MLSPEKFTGILSLTSLLPRLAYCMKYEVISIPGNWLSDGVWKFLEFELQCYICPDATWLYWRKIVQT